ncbi:MAG: hypothetical protein HY906_10985 [Deltaproteobacteria bacterium]|nr:hypothetical protein [Deltaproteobacteria bacterium]
MGALLWAGRGAVVSHRAAAALWGFSRYGEGPVELTVGTHMRAHARLVLHWASPPLAHLDVTRREGLGVTSVPRTLLDLSAIDPEARVRAAVDQALSRRWTTLDHVGEALERAQGRRGTAFMNALLTSYRGGDGPSESELESRVYELLEAEGLPRPVRQREVVVGGRLRRLDFHLPGTPIVIEADGYAAHSSLDVFEDDRRRNNALAARGLIVLHWTWVALRDRPDELAAELRCAVERHGASLALYRAP